MQFQSMLPVEEKNAFENFRKTGRNRTGSNPPSLKTALLFGGAKRHGFYILITQKIIGEISNINAFKMVLMAYINLATQFRQLPSSCTTRISKKCTLSKTTRLS